MMKILVFGNPNVKKDSLPLRLIPELKKMFPKIEFKEFDAIQDISKEGKRIVILDSVNRIKNPRIIKIQEIKKTKPCSLHDFDIGFNLLLLKKLNLIKDATIIGVPMHMSEKEAIKRLKPIISSLSSKSALRNSYRDRKHV